MSSTTNSKRRRFSLGAVLLPLLTLNVSPAFQNSTPPKLLSNVEPTYTRAALDARVQGVVLLSLIVDERGVPRKISVWSPLGFGLDEQAQQCLARWRFKPGLKDGVPVATEAQVQVNFRVLGDYYDQKRENDRTQFNVIVSRLASGKNKKPTEADVSTMRALAQRKFPGAEYTIGVWEVEGEVLPRNASDGLAQIQKAANKNYGPALYFIGKAQLDGTLLPKDEGKGLTLIRDAAVLGSHQAQFLSGDMYEKGDRVPIDLERAKRNFRLCAASGTPECQFRLARLLLASSDRTESQWLQALAWLRLADGHGLSAAKVALDEQLPKLTVEQAERVALLRGQLEHLN